MVGGCGGVWGKECEGVSVGGGSGGEGKVLLVVFGQCQLDEILNYM